LNSIKVCFACYPHKDVYTYSCGVITFFVLHKSLLWIGSICNTWKGSCQWLCDLHDSSISKYRRLDKFDEKCALKVYRNFKVVSWTKWENVRLFNWNMAHELEQIILIINVLVWWLLELKNKNYGLKYPFLSLQSSIIVCVL